MPQSIPRRCRRSWPGPPRRRHPRAAPPPCRWRPAARPAPAPALGLPPARRRCRPRSPMPAGSASAPASAAPDAPAGRCPRPAHPRRRERRHGHRPRVTFYRLIEQAAAPRRADRSGLGGLPTRAYRYCDAVTSAAGFGWHLCPPIDFELLWEAERSGGAARASPTGCRSAPRNTPISPPASPPWRRPGSATTRRPSSPPCRSPGWCRSGPGWPPAPPRAGACCSAASPTCRACRLAGL